MLVIGRRIQAAGVRHFSKLHAGARRVYWFSLGGRQGQRSRATARNWTSRKRTVVTGGIRPGRNRHRVRSDGRQPGRDRPFAQPARSAEHSLEATFANRARMTGPGRVRPAVRPSATTAWWTIAGVGCESGFPGAKRSTGAKDWPTGPEPSAIVARIRSGRSSVYRAVKPCSVGAMVIDGFEVLTFGAAAFRQRVPALFRPLRCAGKYYATAGFLGRPPILPFSREAAAFAGDLVSPPDLPMIPAIHFRDPRAPSSSAGRYRSASSLGK